MLNSIKLKQLNRVFQSFKKEPKTMKEVSCETGILREHICWYCRTLRKNGKLHFLGKRHCTITNRKVKEFSADESYAPPSNQMNFFEHLHK